MCCGPMKDNFRRNLFRLRFILIFIFIGAVITNAQTINQNNKSLRLFYVVYAKAGGYRIMLINEDGNVLLRSRPLLQTNWTFPQDGAAIGRSADGFLTLYTPEPNGILRHRIDERTLQIKRSVTLSVPLVSGILNVTHRKENNFLSVLLGNAEKRYFVGFGLTNSGDFRGDHWVIRSFNCVNINNYCFGPDDAGTSLNGATAYFTKLDGLYKMNLDSKGRGIAPPKLLVKGPEAGSGGSIGSVDFSATTSVNEKLFIYNEVYRAGGSDPGAPDFVYVGKTKNGVLTNPPLKIAQYPWIESGQTVAIDPNGKFVIYYASSQENDHLMYQKLNKNGSPAGKRKVLESYVFPILDIAPYD